MLLRCASISSNPSGFPLASLSLMCSLTSFRLDVSRIAQVVSGLRWLGWWLSQDSSGVAQLAWNKSLRRAPALKDLWGGVAQQARLMAPLFQERKISPKRKFWPGYPCGHPAKNFGQALQILEKQAFWDGHPAWTSMKKLRSEKLRADFFVPYS